MAEPPHEGGVVVCDSPRSDYSCAVRWRGGGREQGSHTGRAAGGAARGGAGGETGGEIKGTRLKEVYVNV